MADIFLSYAREDEDKARPLAEVLTRLGWSVFWDRSIPLGQSWRTVIDEAIESARCVVVLWSEHAVVSRWVVDEAEEGLRKGILVPVAIQAARIPRGFRQVQYADLTDGNFSLTSPRVQALVGDIRRVLDCDPASSVTPAAFSPPTATRISTPTTPGLPPATRPVGPLIPLLRAPLNKADGSAWTLEDWLSAEQAYRDSILKNLRKTRLIGSGQEVDIESLFTDVHFVPEASAARRFGTGLSTFSDFADLVDRRKAERFNAIEALKTHSKLYVLGTPGAGKSTFLRHVAVMCASRQLPGLPVFVALKDWADSGLSLAAFAAQSFGAFGIADAENVVAALLAAPDAAFLFDGLDEVPEQGPSRTKIIKTIDELARKNPLARVLLTCRTSANEHLFHEFRYVEVADFQLEQQRTFVEKWYIDSPKKGEMFMNQLLGDGSRALRDLGRKPLFLAFLCIAFDQTLEFPRSKSALYAEAIEVLLVRWDANRGIQREMYGLVGPQRKKMFLAQLAYRTFELDQYSISTMLIDVVLRRFLQRLPGGDQLEDLDASALGRSFEAAHGILVERSAGTFSFAHLSIHEYFAGVGLTNAVAAGSKWDQLIPAEAVFSLRWREVLSHAGSTTQDGAALMSHLRACIRALVDEGPLLKVFLTQIGYVAGNADMFAEFSRGPLRYLKVNSAFKEGFLEDFVPSSKLESATTQFDRSILYSLKQYREAKKEVPSSLTGVWRRVEVLRETLLHRHGVALLVGMLGSTAILDDVLCRFLQSQELFLALADEAMLVDRETDRNRILGAVW